MKVARSDSLPLACATLVVAGLLEVAWAVGLKYTEGFTRLWPSAFTLATMAGSVGMLGLALRHLPLGTAYAVWTGIGTIGTAVFGMVILGEPAGALRIASIGLIALGIAGLKLLTP
jgi:quaternary ammonium compound-resistance protein SugE